jgi:trk system potassium uptake protein TrkA
MKSARLIVIAGCGSVGSNLAERMSRRGESVVVIDSDPAAFDSLSHDFGGFVVEGDAAEISVLDGAKARTADLLLATTGDDNTNLMIAQMAKEFLGIRRVLALVGDPRRGAIFREFGIDTICPTLAAADLFIASAEAVT